MKKQFYLIVAITFLFSPIYGQDQINEKTADNSEFVVSQRAASVNGTLSGPETFNRFYGMPAPDLNCNGTGAILSAVGTNVYYDVYQIYSPTGENLVASITSGNDSYLMVYCSPFDPNSPFTNARFNDDDGGVGLDAAITAGDGCYLEPNTQYILVVSSFDSYTSFDYELNIGGDVQIAEVYATPLSNWAIYGGIFLILLFTAIRLRGRLF